MHHHRRREPLEEECLDEVVDLWSVREGGERRILPVDEYAGVPMTVTRERA